MVVPSRRPVVRQWPARLPPPLPRPPSAGARGAAPGAAPHPRLDLPVLAPDGSRATLRRVSLPAPFHLGPSLARYRHLGLADRARATWGALALRRLDNEDPALDET